MYSQSIQPKVETMSPICFQYGTSPIHFNWYANYITSKWSYLICCSDQLSLSKDVHRYHIIIRLINVVLTVSMMASSDQVLTLNKKKKKKVLDDGQQ